MLRLWLAPYALPGGLLSRFAPYAAATLGRLLSRFAPYAAGGAICDTRRIPFFYA